MVFLHTAYGRLTALIDSPEDLIWRLLARLGSSGTLVMPRYAWHLDPLARPWKGYAEYFAQRPVIDLRHTPANIGIVPELFRAMEGVETSISHFWPVTAKGRNAQMLVDGQASLAHAYACQSCFGRLLDENAKVLGLGVTLNTTSIAPVTDLRGGHPIFSEPVPGLVVDMAGRAHATLASTMLPSAVRDIKPSQILANCLKPGTDFPFETKTGSVFFSYPAQLYHSAALRRYGAAPNITATLRGWRCPTDGTKLRYSRHEDPPARSPRAPVVCLTADHP